MGPRKRRVKNETWWVADASPLGAFFQYHEAETGLWMWDVNAALRIADAAPRGLVEVDPEQLLGCGGTVSVHKDLQPGPREGLVVPFLGARLLIAGNRAGINARRGGQSLWVRELTEDEAHECLMIDPRKPAGEDIPLEDDA